MAPRFVTVHHVFDNHSMLTRCGVKVVVTARRVTSNRRQVTCRRCLQTLDSSVGDGRWRHADQPTTGPNSKRR